MWHKLLKMSIKDMKMSIIVNKYMYMLQNLALSIGGTHYSKWVHKHEHHYHTYQVYAEVVEFGTVEARWPF